MHASFQVALSVFCHDSGCFGHCQGRGITVGPARSAGLEIPLSKSFADFRDFGAGKLRQIATRQPLLATL
jgi:hypothetical protein